jgi:hypothetical protein
VRVSFTPTRKGLPPELRARVPKRNNIEHQHQVALFEWRDIPAVLRTYPALRLLQGSMNGVALTPAQAGKAKAAGMLKGWPDVQLPVARGQYIGLTCEMKWGKNTATTEQLAIGELLTAEGWLATYHWDWISARDEIIAYLNLPKGEKTPAS